MVVFRTTNSDCCPDYFTHCEGLSVSDDKKYFYQSAAAPLSIIRPHDCPHGVLEISGMMKLYNHGVSQDLTDYLVYGKVGRFQQSQSYHAKLIFFFFCSMVKKNFMVML